MKIFRNCIVSSFLVAVICLTAVGNTMAEAILEEIIVTASKRGAVSVQDTVGGIRAITGDFIEQHNLRSFEDIARLEPSLQFASAAPGIYNRSFEASSPPVPEP